MNASVKTQIVTETETNNIKAQIKEDVMNEAKSIQITTEAPNTNPQIINVPMEMLSVPVSHPRRNSGDMETLQKSISQNGLSGATDRLQVR